MKIYRVIALVSGLAIGLYVFLALLGLLAAFLPGGGGANEIAPAKVCINKPVLVSLQLSVWGSGGDIASRYSNIRMYYRVGNGSSYLVSAPTIHRKDHSTEVAEFTVMPYSSEAPGDLQHYFDLSLDGEANRIYAKQVIKIVAPCLN